MFSGANVPPPPMSFAPPPLQAATPFAPPPLAATPETQRSEAVGSAFGAPPPLLQSMPPPPMTSMTSMSPMSYNAPPLALPPTSGPPTGSGNVLPEPEMRSEAAGSDVATILPPPPMMVQAANLNPMMVQQAANLNSDHGIPEEQRSEAAGSSATFTSLNAAQQPPPPMSFPVPLAQFPVPSLAPSTPDEQRSEAAGSATQPPQSKYLVDFLWKLRKLDIRFFIDIFDTFRYIPYSL